MLIIGTTQIVRKREKGSFLCPNCGSETPYRRKSVQTFLTLYFIPVFPIGKRSDYLECAVCAGTFDPRIASVPREKIVEAIEAAAVQHVGHAMVITLAAQPEVSDEAVDTLRSIYERLSGGVVSTEEVRNQIEGAKNPYFDADEQMFRIADQLDERWSERLVQAVFLVANADGEATPEQMELLSELPALLGMSEERFRELVSDAIERGEAVFR